MKANRRLALLSFCIVTFAAVYVGAFFAFRKRVSITYGFGDTLSNWPGINVYYFSSDPTTNSTLYYFFYPIHHWIGFSDDCLRDANKPLRSPVYSYDLYGLDPWILKRNT